MNEWEKDFRNLSDDLKECAREAVTNVLKEQSDSVLDHLRKNTPRDTGGLVSSLKREEVNKSGKVGYRIIYDGYDEHSQPYQVIANALNRGYLARSFVLIPGRHFIDAATTLLKGTDKKINDEWERLINEKGRRR